MPHDIIPASVVERGSDSTETKRLEPTGDVSARSTTEGDDLRSLEAGLDNLQTDLDAGPSRWRRIARSVVPPIVFLVLLIVAWQLYVVIADPRPDKVPSPLAVTVYTRFDFPPRCATASLIVERTKPFSSSRARAA